MAKCGRHPENHLSGQEGTDFACFRARLAVSSILLPIVLDPRLIANGWQVMDEPERVFRVGSYLHWSTRTLRFHNQTHRSPAL
jgi:hypothetical protein